MPTITHVEDEHYDICNEGNFVPDPTNCHICHVDQNLEAKEREHFAPELEEIETIIRQYKAGIICTSELIYRISDALPVV
jgi:hypothetical protein